MAEMSRTLSATARPAAVVALDLFTHHLLPRLPEPPGPPTLERAVKGWLRRAEIMAGVGDADVRRAAGAALAAARLWRAPSPPAPSACPGEQGCGPAAEEVPPPRRSWSAEAEAVRCRHLPTTCLAGTTRQETARNGGRQVRAWVGAWSGGWVLACSESSAGGTHPGWSFSPSLMWRWWHARRQSPGWRACSASARCSC